MNPKLSTLQWWGRESPVSRSPRCSRRLYGFVVLERESHPRVAFHGTFRACSPRSMAVRHPRPVAWQPRLSLFAAGRLCGIPAVRRAGAAHPRRSAGTTAQRLSSFRTWRPRSVGWMARGTRVVPIPSRDYVVAGVLESACGGSRCERPASGVAAATARACGRLLVNAKSTPSNTPRRLETDNCGCLHSSRCRSHAAARGDVLARLAGVREVACNRDAGTA